MNTELEELFQNKYHLLYACAYRMTGNHHNAEDVLQNAYLKAYKNLHKFEGKSHMYTWLYRIVINESHRFFETIDKLPLQRITEYRGISEAEFFESLSYEPDFNDNIIIEEMREKCLQAFLKCVPKNQRVCFLLKTCLNLKIKEIAEVMGISESNVKITLYRGRQKLKELLQARCNLIDPEKPCECYLWVRYMRDNNIEIPVIHYQQKAEELKKEYFKNMSILKKIGYMYNVEPRSTKEEFVRQLKEIVDIL
ncbi:MAG: RNA polymerase sigma factor [Clostridia bacterium]|nr:RNA polymerase sigma factor [Clostridia bacterium]